MTETSNRLGLWILVAALVLGILGNMLMGMDEEIGLGFSLWITVCVAGLLVLSRATKVSLEGEGRWLLVPAVLLAAAFSWRASPALLVLDLGSLALTLAWAANFGRGGSLRRTALSGYVLSAVQAAVHAITGLLPLLALDIQWSQIPQGKWSRQAASVARGLIIAIPLLLVFGGLFIAADAVFADLVASTFDFGMEDLVGRILRTGFFAWLAAGFFRAALASKPVSENPTTRPATLALGAVETGVILGLLNALFLAFVLVQFRYFFGGADLVQASSSLTYAEYARRGFFELVMVSALVLPVLLLGHWLIPAEKPGLVRLFRWLAGALVAQLFVIMASAVQRMLLYQQEFGLTEQRLYATAFMGWLALLFIWFLLTVLRDHRERFPFGGLVAGLAVLGALHLLNPDALIARVNVERLAAGQRFDAEYAAGLSADAVPVLIDALPRMAPEERTLLSARLAERWAKPGQPGWRDWNWSRMRAYQAVTDHETN